MSDSFTALVNPPFDFTWNDKTYSIKKASLLQVALYQKRAQELSKEADGAADSKLAAYCIYLVLKDQVEGLTEDQVLENTPGAIDILDLFVELGFVNPARLKAALQKTTGQPTTENSGQPSAIAQDGDLETLPS